MWPNDATEVSCDIAETFMAQAPEGKIMTAGSDGVPCWAEQTPLSPREMQDQIQRKKSFCLMRPRILLGYGRLNYLW
ncbi:tail fiber assembly protein [Erwinia persicina]|uniref:tail fiber assembly protein n=1 Tax=Erwinia persicina TaxID=55211 RepID=UPI003CCC6D93